MDQSENRDREMGGRLLKMEALALCLFSAGLLICVFTGKSILLAMMFGYVLFFGYGLVRHHSAGEMVRCSLGGIRTVKNILITFLLIGMITAIWRGSGTIALLVCEASRFCSPSAILLVTFLMCCLISVLTGTSFGSAATMGVICVTIADSMGVPIFYTGGAVLAGVFFGDRCSPMSTSALLVSELTKTDIFRNIGKMVRTSLVPFVLTCLIYWKLGQAYTAETGSVAIRAVLESYYHLSLVTLLPALIVIVFSVLRQNVKITLLVSSICGILIAGVVQHLSLAQLVHLCVFGFSAESAEVAAFMDGGGLISMTRVFLIVCISSCYAGIFKETHFLDHLQDGIARLAGKVTPYGAVLITSVVTSAIACNQTLSIMLTHQLCEPVVKDREELAINLENTAVVIAPLIPWSIAGAVPLATVGAPESCLITAVYLYLIPLWNFAVQAVHHHSQHASGNA